MITSASDSPVHGSNQQLCRVVLSYSAKHSGELELKVDDMVEVMAAGDEGWLRGRINGNVGVFPANHVQNVGCTFSYSLLFQIGTGLWLKIILGK